MTRGLFPRSTFCEATSPILDLTCRINSAQKSSKFPICNTRCRSRARPRERFPCAPPNALAWPLTVAFACANWQVVTVIHKWAGSRPREQGHSILRSRRGHLIVIIAQCCIVSPFTRVSPATRKSRASYVRVHAETETFSRVWAPPARVPIVFTSGGTSAELFYVRTPRRTGYLARDKWKAHYPLWWNAGAECW